MNKRIKELWTQGTQTVVPREGDYSSVSAKQIEKFAELIIQECLNQLQELAPPQVINETHQELVNSAHNYALVVSGAKIKKHFGVEE